jgi:hypothetical protein
MSFFTKYLLYHFWSEKMLRWRISNLERSPSQTHKPLLRKWPLPSINDHIKLQQS